jgi:hypothetical protein
MVAAVDGEAGRMATHWLVPLGTRGLHELIRAGMLVAVMSGLWLSVIVRQAPQASRWMAGLCLAALLAYWTASSLIWSGGYPRMLHIVGDGFGLWWLHFGALGLTPLALLLVWLSNEAPERAGGLVRRQLQPLLFAAALVVTMLVLRREIFAITHAPPLMDFLSDTARRAGYRTLLSLSYAMLALAVYLSAVRGGVRLRLHAAYALYIFTAFKVYLFDLESQNQLYRAFSLLVFAAILFVSSHFASRQQRRQNEA